MSQILDVNATLYDGDIVLFSGRSLFSHSIRTFTNSPWSHCGMVVYDERLGKNAHIWDVSKKTFGGEVALYDLQQRLAVYDGKIAYRPLMRENQQRGLSQEDRDKWQSVQADLAGRRYETSKLELFKAAFDPKIFSYELALNAPDLSSIFCSELVAETYQRLGLLRATIPANEYVPADFGDAHLSLLENGYYLAEEIIIKEPRD